MRVNSCRVIRCRRSDGDRRIWATLPTGMSPAARVGVCKPYLREPRRTRTFNPLTKNTLYAGCRFPTGTGWVRNQAGSTARTVARPANTAGAIQKACLHSSDAIKLGGMPALAASSARDQPWSVREQLSRPPRPAGTWTLAARARVRDS
jgi:hypothetical protein